ncbi:MAG: (Fe-S)-binding protein [Candidatus Korarchaeum sp.]
MELDSAVRAVLPQINPVTLHFLESCVSCGLCTPHCPYIVAGVEYEPVNKAEELRKIVRGKITAAGYILRSLAGAKYPKSEQDLERISYMAYRCVNCRNCFSTCPFGIYSGELIRILRGFLNELGRSPHILRYLSTIERGDLSEVGTIGSVWEDLLERARKAVGKDIPVDKEGAELLYLPTLVEVMLTPEAVISTVRILDKVNENWTIPSKPLGFEFAIGAFIGDVESERDVLKKVNSYVRGTGVRRVLLTHGGNSYEEMRFLMPSIIGEREEFEVIHVIEYLDELISAGKVRLEDRDEATVTWHDPCKLRSSGIKEEARKILKLSSKRYRELPKTQGVFNRCCGGGFGIALLSSDIRGIMGKMTNESFEPKGWEEGFTRDLMEDYGRVIKEKVDEISQVGADVVVTACPTCIYSINRGASIFGKGFRSVHIVHYLADKLIS